MLSDLQSWNRNLIERKWDQQRVLSILIFLSRVWLFLWLLLIKNSTAALICIMLSSYWLAYRKLQEVIYDDLHHRLNFTLNKKVHASLPEISKILTWKHPKKSLVGFLVDFFSNFTFNRKWKHSFKILNNETR